MSGRFIDSKGLDLRLEHSHGSNPDKNQGGHYHIDTTPDIIEYHAYYGIAEGTTIKAKGPIPK